MDATVINAIISRMSQTLDSVQLEQLRNVLMEYVQPEKQSTSVENLLSVYISAKRVEGCSDRTIRLYQSILEKALSSISKAPQQITTNDLRSYLDLYKQTHTAGCVTLDNMRRVLSGFFSWLEDEDYIQKSPVRRIHKVKCNKPVKEVYSDETIEKMRDECVCQRDRAIIELLASTGMRVGELVRLNRADIDFANRECVVLGKGNKQRTVYFDARAKLQLLKYIKTRDDTNEALFVSLLKPHNRLNISGVEIRMRRFGKDIIKCRVHPHKFRRTLATTAIDKGMPVEQVQRLLGHAQIETTMQYAMVNQANVKESHRKFLS